MERGRSSLDAHDYAKSAGARQDWMNQPTRTAKHVHEMTHKKIKGFRSQHPLEDPGRTKLPS